MIRMTIDWDDGGVVKWLHGTSALQSHLSTPRFSMIDITN